MQTAVVIMGLALVFSGFVMAWLICNLWAAQDRETVARGRIDQYEWIERQAEIGSDPAAMCGPES